MTEVRQLSVATQGLGLVWQNLSLILKPMIFTNLFQTSNAGHGCFVWPFCAKKGKEYFFLLLNDDTDCTNPL